jgi:DNA repair exonuclease SbcCD ATPase subunit
MKIIRIKSSNFKQWKDVDIDLSGLKLVSIVGQYVDDKTRSNAAGKSTIGDVIKYALFEWMPTDLKPDDLIAWGENRFEIEMEFEFEGSVYKVRRAKQLGAGSVEFDLMIDGNRVGKNVVERRKILKDALGMNADVADATWFFLQKETNKLTSADPAERKEYLSTVLQSWKWQPVHDIAKKRLADSEAALNNARNQSAQGKQLEDQLTKIDSDIFQTRLAIDDDDAQAGKIRSQFDSNSQRIHELKSSCSFIAAEKTRIKTELDSVSRRRAEAEKRRSKISLDLASNRAGMSHCETSIALNENRMQLIKSQWSASGYPEDFYEAARSVAIKFKDEHRQAMQNEADARRKDAMFAAGVCPTCNQKIVDWHNSADTLRTEVVLCSKRTEQAAEQVRVSAESEVLANTHKNEIDVLAKSNIQMKEKIEAGKIIELSLNEAYTLSVADLERMTSDCNVLVQAAIDTDKKWMEMNGDTVIEQCNSIESEQKRLAYELSGFETNRKELLIRIGGLQNARVNVLNQLELMKNAHGSIAALEQEVKRLKVLVQMFGRDGLALVKTGMAAALIEHYTNELLQGILPEFHVSIAVDSTSARGSLNFQVSTPSGVKSYSVFSGGEKTIVDVCLRMALSKVLAEGVGKRYKTLFLDEVFAELDVRNREFMLALLKHLSKTFSTIFVISHDREMQLSFPQILLIERNGKTSSVQILENSHE